MNCSCLCGGGCPNSDWTALPEDRTPVRGCPRDARYGFYYEVMPLAQMVKESPTPQVFMIHEVLCNECVTWRRSVPHRYAPDRMTIRSLPAGIAPWPSS